MYCPTCGTQNLDEAELRFCRSCGADLRAVSRAINRSLPVRVAASLDAYFENRFQQNLRNGVLNLLAFVFLVVVGTSYLFSGWTGFGIFMLILSAISIVTGIWDIWIYRRNLPPTAKHSQLTDESPKLIQREEQPSPSLGSITEQTTRDLNKDQKHKIRRHSESCKS
jgi:hypothetical protein